MEQCKDPVPRRLKAASFAKEMDVALVPKHIGTIGHIMCAAVLAGTVGI